MATASAAELAARLDRLPMTRHIWVLVTLISLGGAFEFYDLFLTAYIAPGLLKAGYFTPESLGPFSALAPYGVAGVGTFVFAMFAGLFVGAIFLGHFADRYGRRTVFTFSLIWYSITTAIMAFQTSGFAVDLWRFIAAIGIGIELVTIDTYCPNWSRGAIAAVPMPITSSCNSWRCRWSHSSLGCSCHMCLSGSTAGAGSY